MARIMPEMTLVLALGFMVRSKWVDTLLVGGVVALLALGIWALWWDDVRQLLHLGPSDQTVVIRPAPQT
ncbi:MAG: phospholipid carrier-dependent glycosyltransferase [Deltaproteobacteria bacterium]|nr:phospholipid carrier-dependent glycosyltransferase [Deltaproteobacteria bacterium]